MTQSGKYTTARGTQLAWLADGPDGRDDGPCGLFWLGGFMSDMEGSKAEVLAALGDETARPCLRFDYSGHGASGGEFRDGTISNWLGEAVDIFSALADGPRIVVGSSMGCWIAMLLARHLHRHDRTVANRISGIVLIAPATDMTQALMWAGYDEVTRATISSQGYFEEPSIYGDQPYIITRDLIEDGRQHLMLQDGLKVGFPVRILQGEEDPDVPWQHALKTYHAIAGDDVSLTLIKHGDHRLSGGQNLETLKNTCLELCQLAEQR